MFAVGFDLVPLAFDEVEQRELSIILHSFDDAILLQEEDLPHLVRFVFTTSEQFLRGFVGQE